MSSRRNDDVTFRRDRTYAGLIRSVDATQGELAMTNRKMKKKLIHCAVVAAIAASLESQPYAFADDRPIDRGINTEAKTASPIKHVIVIIGENRTFDHVFATYTPGPGESVDNLLSKGIINKDGTPGPNYAMAAQSSAVDNNTYSNHPGQKTPFDNNVQPPGTSYAPQACYADVKTAALDGPGCMA